MRSTTFTYINDGARFDFDPHAMTSHPWENRGATMLQVHALLTQDDPRTRKVLGFGRQLTREEINHAAKTGRMPRREKKQTAAQ